MVENGEIMLSLSGVGMIETSLTRSSLLLFVEKAEFLELNGLIPWVKDLYVALKF